ncbi:hypothetical protein [Streptomyces sp. TLI_146]|uniref:hypothetical protein n=1 Tax=Streptomyces sp. TLI_146 TaxID=1938858 RepID=UPI00117F37EF|nr:hypothetical protein [Streptomyces sp. TLI_146]
MKTTGYTGLSISPSIKSFILDYVLVEEGEWNKVQEANPGALDLVRTRADLEHYIRTGLEFFRPEYIKEDDLPVIAAALRIKFRSALCLWPVDGEKNNRA